MHATLHEAGGAAWAWRPCEGTGAQQLAGASGDDGLLPLVYLQHTTQKESKQGVSMAQKPQAVTSTVCVQHGAVHASGVQHMPWRHSGCLKLLHGGFGSTAGDSPLQEKQMLLLATESVSWELAVFLPLEPSTQSQWTRMLSKMLAAADGRSQVALNM